MVSWEVLGSVRTRWTAAAMAWVRDEDLEKQEWRRVSWVCQRKVDIVGSGLWMMVGRGWRRLLVLGLEVTDADGEVGRASCAYVS